MKEGREIELIFHPDFIESHAKPVFSDFVEVGDFVQGETYKIGFHTQLLDRAKLEACQAPVISVQMPNQLYYFPGEDFAIVRQQMRQLLFESVLHPKVLAAYQQVMDSLGPLDLAAHIRCGDISQNPNSRMIWFGRKFLPVDYYRPLLERNPGTLVLSANRTVLEQLSQEYEIRTIPDLGLGPIVQAMVEILVMGESRVIYGATDSMFLMVLSLFSEVDIRPLTSAYSASEVEAACTRYVQNERIEMITWMMEKTIELAVHRDLRVARERNSSPMITRRAYQRLKPLIKLLYRSLHEDRVVDFCNQESLEAMDRLWKQVGGILFETDEAIPLYLDKTDKLNTRCMQRLVKACQDQPNLPGLEKYLQAQDSPEHEESKTPAA